MKPKRLQRQHHGPTCVVSTMTLAKALRGGLRMLKKARDTKASVVVI